MPTSPAFRGGFLFPRKDAPYRKSKLNYIKCSSAVCSQPQVIQQPCRIADSPQPEAETVFLDIENCSGQAQCSNAPGECRNHENNPFLHISAKRGSRKRNSLMISAGVTFSRYESNSFPALSVKTTRISGEPMRQEMAQ